MEKKSCPPGQAFSGDLGKCVDKFCLMDASSMSITQIKDMIQEDEKVQEMFDLDVNATVVDDKLVVWSGLHQDQSVYTLEEAREMFQSVIDDIKLDSC